MSLSSSERQHVLDGSGTGRPNINVQGFGGAAGSNFTVNVPMEVAEEADMARLRAMVDAYKLAGKKWTMNYQRNIEENENGNSKFFAAAKQGLSLGL